jgi:hypothetical protein
MSKKMPEAAKLYFQNWDVLETARNEVFSVFDDFWPTTWPIIQDRSEAAGLDIPRVWENKASSGNWVLGGRGKAQRSKNKPIKKSTSTGISVWIRDPRVSGEGNCYSVRLRCSGPNQAKLKEEHPDALSSIERVAKKHSLKLNWGNPKRIWSSEIAVDPENLTKTWSEAADIAVKLLSFLKDADATI